MNEQAGTSITPPSEYKSYVNSNKHVISAGTVSNRTEALAYRRARVEKLRELYEENKPEMKWVWVLPAGETDGRKSVMTEEIIGKDVSPFDLPDFEKQMPKVSDYIQNYTE